MLSYCECGNFTCTATNKTPVNDTVNVSLNKDTLNKHLPPTPRLPVNDSVSDNTSVRQEDEVSSCSEERLIKAESEVLIANIALKYAKDEKASLLAQVELLEGEVETLTSVNNKQRNEIKKLLKERDQDKRELSRVSGILKFTVKSPQSQESSKEGILQATLDSLKDHMLQITDQMLAAMEDCGTNGDWTVVGERITKHKNQRVQSTHSSNPSAAVTVQEEVKDHQTSKKHTYATVLKGVPRSTKSASCSTNGQPEPRVKKCAKELPRQQVPNHATERSKPKVIVVGTSLTRGLGTELCRNGVDAICYTYPGTTIPQIASRIPHLLPKSMAKEYQEVVLQCGGNDAEEFCPSSVIKEYEQLIKRVRDQAPYARIHLSTIPLRRSYPNVLEKIAKINTYIKNRGKHNDNVDCIQVCPTNQQMFKNDKVHFNDEGKKMYGVNTARAIVNFHRTAQKTRV